MTPLGALVTAILAISVFALSRRGAALAVIATVCFITQGQQMAILGFHFTAIRFVLLAGFLRVLARGELKRVPFNSIDRALMYYVGCIFVISIIRTGALSELIYQVGCLYNILLAYFVTRALLSDELDVTGVLSAAVYLLIPFTFCLLRESLTGQNFFSIFGDVGTMFRDGHYRTQGPFRSPITAGSLGANFTLMFASMAFAGVKRKLALTGAVVAFLIVIFAHSGGPLMGCMVGLLALACWRYREHTRKIRWGIVISLIVLHLVMKAPVWFLLGRVSDLVGGGGYHRAYVIDQYIKEFGSSWLIGTSDTGDWMPTQLGDGQADLTNQFVMDGVRGGIWGLILSVTVLVRCFQHVAQAMSEKDEEGQKFAWGMGATLVGNIAILFSVTYFDQMQVIWYFMLACIACLNNSPGFIDQKPTPDFEKDDLESEPEPEEARGRVPIEV